MKRVTRFRDRPAHRRSSRWPWTLPPRSGYLRRACPDCYQIDPDLMHQLIGDGYGPGTRVRAHRGGRPVDREVGCFSPRWDRDRMNARDLPELIEAYRKASQTDLRNRLRTGKRAEEQQWKAGDQRTEIDNQLHALGEHDLRGSLVSEHVLARDIITHLTGQPGDELTYDLDAALERLQHHRGQTAKRLASVSRGTVTG